MANKKQLKIKLLPNGEIQMETIGIKGKKCLNYVEILKNFVNLKIEKQELTKEYYEEENEMINSQQHEYISEDN